MMSPAHEGGVSLGDSAIYEIVVQGVVSSESADRLGELALEVCTLANRSSTTRLTGRLLDQSHLLGVLNALYELRMPILRIERESGD